MPPTFLALVVALFYLPTLGALALSGLALMLFPKTRMLGKRLLFAALATVPGMLLGGVIIGALAIFVLGAILAVTARHTHNGTITSPAVAAIAGTIALVGIVAGGAILLGSFLVSARVGWGMADGLSMWQVIERHRWLRHLDPWYGTLRPKSSSGITSGWS